MQNSGHIEFFAFEGELWYRSADGTQRRLTESDPVVREMFDHISEFYPDAFAELEKRYSRCSPNIVHYRYRVVRRFCGCNFGSIDNVPDICSEGRMHFERVSCPLRGECPMEGIVCCPKFNSKISPAEMRVLELIYRHVSIEDIANRLCQSAHTTRNHRRNAFQRIGVHSTAEFIAYANTHGLFKTE